MCSIVSSPREKEKNRYIAASIHEREREEYEMTVGPT